MNKYLTTLILIAVVLAPFAAAQEASAPAPASLPDAQPVGAPAASPDSDNIENTTIGGGLTDAGPTAARSQWVDTLKMVGTLLLVIGVIVIVVFLLRRLAPRTVAMYASDNLRLLARTYVGPRQMVCLMKAPGRLLVIGATQANISILSEITDPAEVERILGAAEAASPRGASAAFRDLLGSVTGTQKKSRAGDDLAAAVNDVSQRFADLAKRMDEPRMGND